MKLVDILARELKVWPEGLEVLSQFRHDGSVVNGKGFDGRVFDRLEIAEDTKPAGVLVTRSQWQAAVDALKTGEQAMQSIDWSKAPEGATHFDPVDCNYLRQLGTIAQCWHKSSDSWTCKGWQYPDDLSTMGRLIKRPVWSGEGLPPVGIKVDVLLAGNGSYLPLTPQEWQPMTMKYRSVDFCVFEREDGQEFPMWNPQYSKFRPIRTAEQIAAEEREKAIMAMVDDSGFDVETDNIWPAMEALHNAGYRKQEAQQ